MQLIFLSETKNTNNYTIHMCRKMSFIANLHSVCQTMPNGNIEFSWIETEYNGMNILPKVRHQEDDSCIFQAICAGTEMAIKRDAASKNPPRTSDIEFNTSSFVENYENHTNRKIGDEPLLNLPLDTREETAINLFRSNGVLVTSTNWEGEQRVKLSRQIKVRRAQFDRVADFIRLGKPVVGSLPTNEDFLTLGPDEIYEYVSSEEKTIENSHMVLFVGYGYKGSLNGERYLIFMNSHGEEFGDRGFGRVYFDEIFRDRLYVLYADTPRIPSQNLNVSTSAPKREPTQDPDDRPAQRVRLGGDGSSSLAGGKHPSTSQGD